MRMTEFMPWNQSSIGFERLFEMIGKPVQGGRAEHYPPYDIEKTGESAYRIRLAVAGFSPEDLTITSQANLLIVGGKKARNASGRYLYRGIAARAFRRRFYLADNVRVVGAALANGMLTIELAHDVPDATNPRRIEIANSNQPQTEGKVAA